MYVFMYVCIHLFMNYIRTILSIVQQLMHALCMYVCKYAVYVCMCEVIMYMYITYFYFERGLRWME